MLFSCLMLFGPREGINHNGFAEPKFATSVNHANTIQIALDKTARTSQANG
jgi:hypothetical protein